MPVSLSIGPFHCEPRVSENAKLLSNKALLHDSQISKDAQDVDKDPLKTDGSPVSSDTSTTVGSALSDTCSEGDEAEGDWLSQDESPEDEEEEGAKEEAEFSLDGRLATLKRWRRFQALGLQPEPMLQQSGPALSSDGMAKLLAPPGLCGMSCDNAPVTKPQPHTPAGLDFNLLNINGALLMQTRMPGLEEQIRLLSQRALGVDTWEALLRPEPEDPDWQLLALVGKDCLAGFSTYAFFPEDQDNGSTGLIMSIHHVVVDELLRGTGHGSRMLKDLLSRARIANAWAVKLYSKPLAVGFYERLGFKLVGPDLLMELRLFC